DIGNIHSCHPRASGGTLTVLGTALSASVLPSGEKASAASLNGRSWNAGDFCSPSRSVQNQSAAAPTMSSGRSSRRNAIVVASGETAARLTSSITTCGVPPAALIDQRLSRFRASEMKYRRLPSGDQNGYRQS